MGNIFWLNIFMDQLQKLIIFPVVIVLLRQLSFCIFLMETWKILKSWIPIVLWQNEPNRQTNDREVRTTTIREWKEDSISKIGNCCFVIDAARLWNQLPSNIKVSTTINQAKNLTKNYCKQLPTDHWNLTFLILALWPKQCSPYFVYPL